MPFHVSASAGPRYNPGHVCWRIYVLEVFVSETIRVYSDLSLKYRERGRKRPVSEQKVNDYYFEKIVHRETGELILLREGRLSEHRGHRSAKR